MAVNLANKYSSKVDERFTLASVTEAAVNQEYDWDGVISVTVYSVATVDLNNYVMAGKDRYGTPAELDDEKQTLQLSQDRAFTYTIDRLNRDATMMTKEAGRSLRRQIDEKVIPEIDQYRLIRMGVFGGITNTTPAPLSTANMYDAILEIGGKISNAKAPRTGRILYASYKAINFIKKDEFFMKQSEIAQNMLITGQVGAIDGNAVIEVPEDYLPAGVGFIITHSIATTSPKKLEQYREHIDPPGINGTLVEGRIVYDAFVLNNKRNAIGVWRTE